MKGKKYKMIAVFAVTIIGFFAIGFIYGYRYGRDKRIQIEDEEMEFLEFLYDKINPNDMKRYRSMFNMKNSNVKAVSE